MRLPATIVAIRQETPTIKSFAFDLHGREIGFMAGQWVDFFVTLEGAEAVGGYSITSSPAEQTTFSLAVKQDGSDHPVTNWLHDDARVGDEVEVALGGDFYYEPEEADSVVLIAGGIGLTPLMSIVRSANELATRTRLALVYSAATPDELLFREELVSIADANPRIRPVFTVTQPESDAWDGHTGRIDAGLLRSESVDLNALFFVCGPPAMIRAMIAMLRELGVPRPRIRYEQWW
ncbi:MAG: oxidoreductase [Dehalococcoidia bacterium]|nr:oxidoreductase [Dehalococcoidia bacterium]